MPSPDIRIWSLRPQKWRLEKWFWIRGKARDVIAFTVADVIDNQTAVVHATIRRRMGPTIYGLDAFELCTTHDVLHGKEWGEKGCLALVRAAPCYHNGAPYLPALYKARDVDLDASDSDVLD